MTGWGSVDLAVEAMRRGVRDFVQKPWDNCQLIATLRSEIERGRERRQRPHREQREMEEARRIQRQLLPTALPHIEGWELASSWQPAAGVGGDCFDAITFEPARIALSIADVVGKGIPAALLMSNLQAAVRAFRHRRPNRARAVPTGQSDPLRPHRRRTLHQFLLLHHRHRSRHAHLLQRWSLSADCGARRRHRRTTDCRRCGARRIS